MESYPRQCRTPDGKNFIENITQLDKSDLIVVTSPRSHDKVKSPLTVRGKARGNWFFEASFPVELISSDGTVLAQTAAQAKGDWMTSDFVAFEATLSFPLLKLPSENTSLPVTLVLKKDNQSGLPEHDDSISIPLVVSTGTSTGSACRPTGCSGQLCSDEEVITTCEYRAEYTCYKSAECKRQADGTCGWRQTQALKQCLLSKRSTYPTKIE
jgi:hypothetical protein